MNDPGWGVFFTFDIPDNDQATYRQIAEEEAANHGYILDAFGIGVNYPGAEVYLRTSGTIESLTEEDVAGMRVAVQAMASRVGQPISDTK